MDIGKIIMPFKQVIFQWRKCGPLAPLITSASRSKIARPARGLDSLWRGRIELRIIHRDVMFDLGEFEG
jgi:hypothetical protein